MNTTSHLLPANTLLEEEENPDYSLKRFYPARVGKTIQKYQIISKLSWGTIALNGSSVSNICSHSFHSLPGRDVVMSSRPWLGQEYPWKDDDVRNNVLGGSSS
jgi:hypothetical protein